MFTTVLFDLDGTLLNTLTDIANAGNHALSAMQLPTHSIENYRTMVGNGIPKLIERMLPSTHRGPATQELALSLFSRYYSEHMYDYTAPYPGITEMLHTLKAEGIQLAVLSNKEDAFVPPIIQRYFPGIFTISMGHKQGFPPKPAPTSTYYMLEQLHAFSTETLYCGDSDVDIFTGTNAGLCTCGVLWGFRSEKELSQAGATFLAKDTNELAQIILHM